MKMNKMLTGALLVLAMLAVAVAPAYAADDVTLQGSVTAINEVSGTFTLTTEDGTVYTVTAPAGLDWTSLSVGAQVEIFGDSDELGGFAAESVTILASSEEPPVEEDWQNPGFYCSSTEAMQPALQRLAESHLTDYANVLAMFCGGGLGVGGVNHVLNASADNGQGADVILAMRAEMGWGQVWKALNEPRGEDEGETEQAVESTHPGNGHGQGNGNGQGNGHGNGRGHNK